MEDAGRKSVGAWPVVVFLAVCGVLVALFVKLFLSDEVSAALVVAIAAVSGLLILSPRVFELAELSIGKDGLVAKIREVEKKVERAEKKIDRLFASTMSDSMYGNLRKLASGRFGHFRNNGGLRRELTHLRDVGYVEVNGAIGDLPAEGNDLSDHVTVTQVGKEFVAFRDSMEGNANP